MTASEQRSMARSSPVVLLSAIVLICTGIQSGSTTSTSPTELLKDLSAMLDAAYSGFKYCPPPYYHILGECFYVHQYIPQLTWQEAQDFCKQAGGIGAEPKHFGAVIAQLFNMGKSKAIYNWELNSLWLGGHRVGNTTTFRWSSSGRPITENVVDDVSDTPAYYSDFEGGDCIMIVMARQGPSTLRAAKCDSRVHYICQLP